MNTQQLVSQLQSRIDRRGNYIAHLESTINATKDIKDIAVRRATTFLHKSALKEVVKEQVRDKKLMDNLHEQQFQERLADRMEQEANGYFYHGGEVMLGWVDELPG